MPTLDVYFNNTPCARLTEGADGAMQFQYLEAWLQDEGLPVSLGLPVADAVYGQAAVAPFVAAFLPEGEGLRSRLEKILHVDAEHDFGLLAVIGRECAGALSFWPQGETPFDQQPKYSALSLEDFRSWREFAQQHPLQFPGKTIRLSLAGAQAKTALFFDDDDHPYFPENGAPTSHILKPRIPACVPNTVHTELLTMRLARAVLGDDEVPSVDMWQNCYRIRRFDRPKTESGLKRLHQEDFCLALGRMPAQKYESANPPERLLGSCFTLLDRLGDAGLVISPALERMRLLNQVILNVLLHNPDAHLKNYALLYRDDGSLRIAPLYDSLCTAGLNFTAQGSAGAPDAGLAAHTREMSLHIGNASKIDRISRQDWACFATECGFTQPFVRRRVHARAAAVSDALQAVTDSILEEHPQAEPAAQAIRSCVNAQVKMALT